MLRNQAATRHLNVQSIFPNLSLSRSAVWCILPFATCAANRASPCKCTATMKLIRSRGINSIRTRSDIQVQKQDRVHQAIQCMQKANQKLCLQPGLPPSWVHFFLNSRRMKGTEGKGYCTGRWSSGEMSYISIWHCLHPNDDAHPSTTLLLYPVHSSHHSYLTFATRQTLRRACVHRTWIAPLQS